MDNVKINRVSSFNEWLKNKKLNENKAENAKEWDNHVYGFVEYNGHVNESVCNLKFDHYDGVLDQVLNDIEKDAPGLKYADVLALARNKTSIDNEYDSIDKFLYDLVKMHLRGERIKVQDKEIDDETVNDNDLQVYRTAERLFIFKMIKDIKQKFVYEDAK